jgi:DNA-binding NtrC family response regulator
LLLVISNMSRKEKQIIIIDEHGFSRICSGILSNGGYKTSIVTQEDDLQEKLKNDIVGLVVTSYPYGASHFDALKKRNIPIIVLTDNISDRLLMSLNSLQNSCCMIKPLNYDKFKSLVKQVFEGSMSLEGGYRIV